MTPVVVHRWSKVKSFFRSGCPGSTVFGTDVGDNLDAWRCYGSTVVVELPMQLGIDREVWIDSRGSKEVEGEHGLRDELVPKMK